MAKPDSYVVMTRAIVMIVGAVIAQVISDELGIFGWQKWLLMGAAMVVAFIISKPFYRLVYPKTK